MSRGSWIKALTLVAALLGLWRGEIWRRLRTGPTTCTGRTCPPRSRATASSTMGSTTGGIAILGNSGLFPRFRGLTTGTTMAAIGFWASSGTRTAGTNGTRRSSTRATHFVLDVF